MEYKNDAFTINISSDQSIYELGETAEIDITGHEGRQLANLLGQKLENEGEKTFTYTFATPNTTTSKNISNYKSIFNIVNGEYAVSMLPFDGGVDSEK